MPLPTIAIDDRRFTDIRDEALARIPVHNPEWTNFNKSDPGVTLIEVFAFLTESLLYRANQIPDRNRRKFLELLGLPLRPATAARGIVAFSNDRGPLESVTLPTGFEVRAGQIPFRLEQGLDVLPIEGHAFYKRKVKNPAPELVAYYEQLYASFLDTSLGAKPNLYETVPVTRDAPLNLANDTVDGCLWLALAARKADAATAPKLADLLDDVRSRIANKTLTVGIAPWLADGTRESGPGAGANADAAEALLCEIPNSKAFEDRKPNYVARPIGGTDVLSIPGTVQIPLPGADGLELWEDLDPLESGADKFPPTIADAALEARVITWLRFSAPNRPTATIQTVAINAAMVQQGARVPAEQLPNGTGAPDQTVKLSHGGILPDSITVYVTIGGKAQKWTEIADLADASAEVPVPNLVPPPTTPQSKPNDPYRFSIDHEAGELHFGDGVHGARPPAGAPMVAEYAYSDGAAGNVNMGAINSGAALPPGFSVTNPLRTWGGSDAESVSEGEKQVSRYVQHRDRLVSAEDFLAITWRTPGVEMGRVEIIPAARPKAGRVEPGDAPGAVTVLVIPRRDAVHPAAPEPDLLFLDAVCKWLDPRRLVTTELYVRGPEYKDMWVSVGIDVAVGRSIAEVRKGVEQALRTALSPLPPPNAEIGVDALMPVFAPVATPVGGWPLRKKVDTVELAAVAARVEGVTGVRGVLLALANDSAGQSSIPMEGLQLPRLANISVGVGEPLALVNLQGNAPGAGGPPAGGVFVPVPVVPEEC